jgi:bacterioferritin
VGSPALHSGDLMTDTFAIDVTRPRDGARQHFKQGPVTPSNTTDVGRIITVLNQVVATEMVCYLRYTQNAIVAQGIDRELVADMFRDHAAGELGDFQRVSERVNQLGGSPDMNPATMKERSSTDYSAPPGDTDRQGMIRQNLIAERIVIGAYAEIIRWLGTADPTSRRLIEDILRRGRGRRRRARRPVHRLTAVPRLNETGTRVTTASTPERMRSRQCRF